MATPGAAFTHADALSGLEVVAGGEGGAAGSPATGTGAQVSSGAVTITAHAAREVCLEQERTHIEPGATETRHLTVSHTLHCKSGLWQHFLFPETL